MKAIRLLYGYVLTKLLKTKKYYYREVFRKIPHIEKNMAQ